MHEETKTELKRIAADIIEMVRDEKTLGKYVLSDADAHGNVMVSLMTVYSLGTTAEFRK